jgi:NDP-sugar pyrophosphorylase family protein
VSGRALSALVLAAGLGTRLRPLTCVRAKAAAPVAGVPLVARVLGSLSAAGVRDAVINLHHLPASITGLVGDASAWGLRVRYSWEPAVLGSAGGPRRALPLLESDPFLIVNADTLTDLHVRSLAAAHAASRARVTLAVVPNPAPDRYGGVIVAPDGRVEGFSRRGDPRPSFHFIGVQVAAKSIFAPLADGVPAESVSGIYADLIVREPGSVRAHLARASFHDIGTLREYLETSLAVARSESRPESVVGERSRVASDATLTRTIVWDNAVIGEGCELIDCVVADDVVLPARTRLARAAIVPASACAAMPGGRRLGDAAIFDIPVGVPPATDPKPRQPDGEVPG